MKKAAGEEVLEDESVSAAAGSSVQKLVTADGTYATQSAFSSGSETVKKNVERPPLRKYLMEGDFFIGAALGGTLTKLAIRFADLVKVGVSATYNTYYTKVIKSSCPFQII